MFLKKEILQNCKVEVKKMESRLIIIATILLILGLFMLALRLFFSMSIQDLGFANIDVICIFIPVICIIFGILLFFLGMKKTD